MHSFTGSNWVSGFAGKGKKDRLIIKTTNLNELVKPFYEPNSDLRNSCAPIASVYNCKNAILSLDDFWFQWYKLLTARLTFPLEKSTRIVGAATQHSSRALSSASNAAWK